MLNKTKTFVRDNETLIVRSFFAGTVIGCMIVIRRQSEDIENLRAAVDSLLEVSTTLVDSK